MNRSKLVALGCLPLVLAACGGGDDVAVEDTGPVVETVDTTGMAAAPAPMDTGMAAGMNTVQMNPVGNSGVSGEAALSDANGQTQVAVTLTGTTGTGTHQGHIHQGTCDSPGQVVAPLQPITAGASASSTSTASLPMSTVMDGRHIVVYHEAGGSPGSPIVCGAIPQHAM